MEIKVVSMQELFSSVFFWSHWSNNEKKNPWQTAKRLPADSIQQTLPNFTLILDDHTC